MGMCLRQGCVHVLSFIPKKLSWITVEGNKQTMPYSSNKVFKCSFGVAGVISWTIFALYMSTFLILNTHLFRFKYPLPTVDDAGIDRPLILFWTLKNGKNLSVSWHQSFRYLTEQKCPIPYCIFTTDQNVYDKANAIIFHLLDFEPGVDKLPPKRWAFQRYVFYNREPPTNHNIFRKVQNITFIKGFFNWTMTIRRDSDIYAPYVSFKQTSLRNKRPNVFKLHTKTHMIAWFVSRCKSFSKREDYVEELSRFIPVDIFGKCGSLSCPRDNARRCYRMLRKYKFYLSFENSICKDYITEKVIYPMMYAGVIPVVRGGANYSFYLPPNSYINVDDFESPKQLSEFLFKLSEDPEKYNSFFDWHNRYIPVYSPNAICKLCKTLLQDPWSLKQYNNMDKWWNHGQCKGLSPRKAF